jgi:hypothetical protein
MSTFHNKEDFSEGVFFCLCHIRRGKLSDKKDHCNIDIMSNCKKGLYGCNANRICKNLKIIWFLLLF